MIMTRVDNWFGLLSLTARQAVSRALLALLTLLMTTVVQAELSVTLDRNPVRVNESFTLDIKTSEVDADEPRIDWPDGLQQLRRNTISSRSIINGKVSAERTWRYSLIARQPGDYVIPALTIGNEQSAAMTVSVLAANSKADKQPGNQPILLKVSTDQQSVYAQQQLILTVQLLRNVPLRFAQLSEPNLPTALVQKLGDDSEYDTTINGVGYQVIERRYAIFPQQVGDLRIDPIRFQADVNAERQLSLFGAFNETQPVSLESEAIHIEVQAPAQTDNWLPAQQLTLTDAVSSEPYRVGEPLTWTVTLIADGLLPAQLPTLTPASGQQWKLYPDQPQDQLQLIATGVRTVRSQKFALVPLQAGELTLPALTVPWWRVTDQSSQTATVAPLQLTVEPAINLGNGHSPAAAIKTPAPVKATTTTAPALDELAHEPAALDTATTATAHNLWPWLTALFASLWLATLALWLWRHKNLRPKPSAAAHDDRQPAPPGSAKALREACKRGDADEARRQLLKLTGADSLGALATGQRPAIVAMLDDLQQALYGPPPQRWQGEPLAAVVDELLRSRTDMRKNSGTSKLHTDGALPPLYPNR